MSSIGNGSPTLTLSRCRRSIVAMPTLLLLGIGTTPLISHPRASHRAGPRFEKRFTEEFNANDLKGFAETIDAAHVSGNSGWFVGHWSATFLSRASGERRPIKGYVAAVLERRNGEWKARIHITNYER